MPVARQRVDRRGLRSDATIRIVRVSSGEEVFQIRLEPQEVAHVLAFSPDAKTIASASGEGAVIQLWDATTGKEVSPYHRHNGRVYAIAFSPDDRSLASAGCDGSLRLWEATTGRPIRAILDSPLRVRDAANESAAQRILLRRIGPRGSIAFGREGIEVISVSDDGAVSLWDLAAQRDVHRVRHRVARPSAQLDLTPPAGSSQRPTGTVHSRSGMRPPVRRFVKRGRGTRGRLRDRVLAERRAGCFRGRRRRCDALADR